MVSAPMPGPVSSAARRARRLTPSTSWVAFSARAKSSSAVRHVVADDLVVGAAEGLDQQSLGGQGRGVGAGEPVGAGDVDGEQVAARWTGRRSAPRGGSGSRPRGRR